MKTTNGGWKRNSDLDSGQPAKEKHMASVGRPPKGKNSSIPNVVNNPREEGDHQIPNTVSGPKEKGQSTIPNCVSGPKES